MNLDLSSTTFNGMAAQDVQPFVQKYSAAVMLGDVNWLEAHVPNNKSLTTENRRWLSNLETADIHHLAFSVSAVASNNHRLLGFLLREGASPDVALPGALLQRDSTAVKMLCDAKADVDMAYHSVPLLTLSAIVFDADSCGHLLDAKANINGWRNNDRQCTALFDCIGAYEQHVRKAFESGMSEKAISDIPRQDALRTIGLLLERGADEHQKGHADGHSAYELAEMFSGVDPRPLELIHEWRSDAAAKVEMNNLMARMRRPSSGPA